MREDEENDTRHTVNDNVSAWTEAELASTQLPEEWYKHSAGFTPAHGQDRMLLMFVAGEVRALSTLLQDR